MKSISFWGQDDICTMQGEIPSGSRSLAFCTCEQPCQSLSHVRITLWAVLAKMLFNFLLHPNRSLVTGNAILIGWLRVKPQSQRVLLRMVLLRSYLRMVVVSHAGYTVNIYWTLHCFPVYYSKASVGFCVCFRFCFLMLYIILWREAIQCIFRAEELKVIEWWKVGM